ncbi:hypothetical protein GQ43DRAFT_204195 [Delitschia confertaspora ATCC 74209]|uniref:Methyltransferase domain-containing protein n=1 Tax=Delitschia confertaspora ATCC 74209 TaxID=1513339 RepID=A0A9P4JGA9_9PLEO|nr:hypothetical protein GQ43DRAFT_204195 [Delitschia confertaspora ATCC 74209]
MSTVDAQKWAQLPADHMARSTKLPWYTASFEHKLTPSFRNLLKEWSGIAPEDVVPHIYRIREESWRIFPWPCIGEFWFIEQGLLRHPDYASVLQKLKTIKQAKFLDLGTCLGQDLRTLAHANAPLPSLYGADALPGFEAAGHALFNDRDRLDSTHFITGNIFSETDDLAKTRGSWDIVHIAMFLHVFSKADAEAAARNILKLLKNEKETMVIGTQTGSLEPTELVLQPPLCEPGEHKTVWRQSRETMVEMWKEAANSVGLDVEIWAEYDEEEARQRANGRREKGEGWEKRERFFTGDKERRIFFRVVVK